MSKAVGEEGPSTSAAAGRVLDPQGLARFTIRRKVGSGAFGVVYEAFDRERGALVALKTLDRVEPRAIYRLKQEFRSLADIAHPNLVALHELFCEDGQWFFTMDYIDGVSFLEHIRSDADLAWADTEDTGGSSDRFADPHFVPATLRDSLAGTTWAPAGTGPAIQRTAPPPSPRLPPPPGPPPSASRTWTPPDAPKLRAALAQLATGIQAIHAAGKLHRDLKPQNVLVTRDGRVVILDFGLVTEIGPSGEGDGALPGDALIVGTPAYMSPEQAGGLPLTPATDWYAVGVMLFQALTGRVPFNGTSLFEVLNEKQHRDAPAPRQLVAGVPEDLDALCADLLRRRPWQRPSGREVKRRLGVEGREEGAGFASSSLRGGGAATIVGRGAAIERLREAFIDAARGRPVTVLVHGVSGMGKSALVRRFLDDRRLRLAEEAIVLSGRCYERESVPFKGIDSLVDALTRYLLALPTEVARELLPRDIQALERAFPVLRRVAAVVEAPREGADAPDVLELRSRAFAALREMLVRLCRPDPAPPVGPGGRTRGGSGAEAPPRASDRPQKPVVLFIDDLQWGDVDSAVLLTDLLKPPDPPPVLLLLAYRSEELETSPVLRALLAAIQAREVGAGAGTGMDVREVVVGPLDRDESRGLALTLLRGEAASADGERTLRPDELRDLAARQGLAEDPVSSAIFERLALSVASEARGSPFFIEELVAHVLAEGHLASSSSEVSLRDVIHARVGRLPEGARRLLETVAVAGRPLGKRVVYEAAGLGREGRGDEALAVLRAGRLALSREVDAEERVECHHDRIREAVAARLPGPALREHHERLAGALEASGRADPEMLFEHYRAAGDLGRAARCADAAAANAARALAFDRAASYCRLALELGPADGPARRALLERLAEALASSGRGPEAAKAYLEAAGSDPEWGSGSNLALTSGEGLNGNGTGGNGTGKSALELRRRAAEQLLRSGRIDEGLDVLRTVLDAVGMRFARTPRRALLSFLARRVWIRLRGLRFKEREERAIPALTRIRIDTCWSVAASLSAVDTIRGADFQAKHLLLALKAGEPYRVARALAVEAGYMAVSGGPTRHKTARLLEAADALSRRIGHPHAEGVVALVSGMVAMLEGRWRAGRDHCDRALKILRDRCTGVAWETQNARLYSLFCCYYMGEVRDLAVRVRAALDEAEERGDHYMVATVCTGIGSHARLAADDPVAARKDLEEGLKRWPHRGFHLVHLNKVLYGCLTELYDGKPHAAWARLVESARAIEGSLLLRAQSLRIFYHGVRGRCALAAAAAEPAGPRRDAFLETSARAAARLEKEHMPWSDPLALGLRAGAAACRGDSALAVRLFAAADAGFAAADMALHAAVARRRRGELVGGEAGRAFIAAADRFMAGQDIKNPARMAGVLGPGFTASTGG